MRWLTYCLAAVLALFIIACDAESDGKSQPAKNGGPGKVHNNPPPNDKVDVPGPVQGDPSAHPPTPGNAEIKLAWSSETKVLPKVEYSIGGGQIPATNLNVAQSRKGYTGWWAYEIPVKSGQTIGATMYGTSSFTFTECYIVWKGQVYSHQISNRNCATSYTIP